MQGSNPAGTPMRLSPRPCPLHLEPSPAVDGGPAPVGSPLRQGSPWPFRLPLPDPPPAWSTSGRLPRGPALSLAVFIQASACSGGLVPWGTRELPLCPHRDSCSHCGGFSVLGPRGAIQAQLFRQFLGESHQGRMWPVALSRMPPLGLEAGGTGCLGQLRPREGSTSQRPGPPCCKQEEALPPPEDRWGCSHLGCQLQPLCLPGRGSPSSVCKRGPDPMSPESSSS